MRQGTPLLLALGLLLAACGGAPVDEAATSPERYSRDCRGKPSPPVGKLEVEIVERLSDDRVVVEARWGPGVLDEDRRVELVLPDGAWLVGGRRTHALAGKPKDGVMRWTVGHETGAALDAVVRLRARSRGQDVGREACVRLAQGPRRR